MAIKIMTPHEVSLLPLMMPSQLKEKIKEFERLRNTYLDINNHAQANAYADAIAHCKRALSGKTKTS
jgi:hypothetical protein